MEKTYTIPPEKVEGYLLEYNKRDRVNVVIMVIWATSIFIGTHYNITTLPVVVFVGIFIFSALTGNLTVRRKSWRSRNLSKLYLQSSFVITNDYVERMYEGKSAGKVRFKSQFALTESQWGLELRTYTLFKKRPFEWLRAQLSNRLEACHENYYVIYIPTITEHYDELKALLLEKLKQ
ncbi:MAG: hypothetical protein M0D57_06350 [Sphingobacteriales bacterium JAD_PAG50586_3]|nr:MAG: hypothetical protein M0D57_06350 [Sphingobacteriales bacterium JAD_PAG50586_3]